MVARYNSAVKYGVRCITPHCLPLRATILAKIRLTLQKYNTRSFQSKLTMVRKYGTEYGRKF